MAGSLSPDVSSWYRAQDSDVQQHGTCVLLIMLEKRGQTCSGVQSVLHVQRGRVLLSYYEAADNFHYNGEAAVLSSPIKMCRTASICNRLP